ERIGQRDLTKAMRDGDGGKRSSRGLLGTAESGKRVLVWPRQVAPTSRHGPERKANHHGRNRHRGQDTAGEREERMTPRRRTAGAPPSRSGSLLLLLPVLFGHRTAGGLLLATLLRLRRTATLLAALVLTATMLLLAALLLTHLVLVQLNGTSALLVVPILVHPLLFLIHGGLLGSSNGRICSKKEQSPSHRISSRL